MCRAAAARSVALKLWTGTASPAHHGEERRREERRLDSQPDSRPGSSLTKWWAATPQVTAAQAAGSVFFFPFFLSLFWREWCRCEENPASVLRPPSIHPSVTDPWRSSRARGATPSDLGMMSFRSNIEIGCLLMETGGPQKKRPSVFFRQNKAQLEELKCSTLVDWTPYHSYLVSASTLFGLGLVLALDIGVKGISKTRQAGPGAASLLVASM